MITPGVEEIPTRLADKICSTPYLSMVDQASMFAPSFSAASPELGPLTLKSPDSDNGDRDGSAAPRRETISKSNAH